MKEFAFVLITIITDPSGSVSVNAAIQETGLSVTDCLTLATAAGTRTDYLANGQSVTTVGRCETK